MFRKKFKVQGYTGYKKKLFLGTKMGIAPKRSKRFQFRLNHKKGLDHIYNLLKFEGDPIIFRGLNNLRKNIF